MPPSRRKGASKAAAAAAARRKWKVGDLVLAKVKGFPAWPATVSEPEKWGYSTDLKKVLVYFFGTQQIAFCNPADVEAFTEEKKQSLLVKRQGKGADFVRAVQEIIDSYEKSKKVNGGNSVDSSNNISKDEEEVPTETLELDSKPLGDKREPCLPIEDVVKQAGSLHEKDSVQEKLTESLLVAESSLLAIYTSRKRSGGSRQENSVPQRRALPVRRSRSSSRVESGPFQNFVVSNNDGGKVGGNIVANGARDGSVRRNKWNSRKSPDILDCDDRGSLALAYDVSAEDNGSDTVSVESDSLGVNVGNILDSGSKPENSETVGFKDGGIECSKGLDLQIKAGVMKKKRKPNRKWSLNEANENIARLQKDAGLNGEENDTGQNSHHICVKTNESESMEDGDEHLPLVKRARVRMGKPSSVEEPSRLQQVEEKAPDEVSASSVGHNSLALTCNSYDTLDRNTFLVKGTTDNTSPSKGGTQYSGNQTHFWKVKKKQLFGGSADGEAALPPSKRLLRALEAMSANAAEEEQRCITALTKNSSINGCCVSPTSRCRDMAVENREGNGFGSRSVDYSAKSVTQIGASGFFTSLNPMSSEETTSSGGVDICDTPIQFFERKEHEFDKDSAAETTGVVERSNPIGSPAGTDAVQMVGNCGSLESLLSSAVMGQATSNQVSFNQFLPSQDESGGKELVLSNCKAGSSYKELDISEHDIPSANIVQGIGEDNKVSPGDDAKMHAHCSCGTGCENVESLKSQVDGSCQVNGSCEAVSDRVELKEEQKGTSSASVSSDDCTSKKNPSDVLSSPYPTVGVDFPGQSSPSTLIGHIPTTESVNFPKSNGSCSPNDRLEHNISFVTPVVGEGKGESVTQKTVLFSKWGNHAEAQAALSSFEAILGTLTGKKEIIGRATRIAIECGKLGLAAKVMEILTHNLESETSLHRRVDLFFLVDSITQCSRNMRGDVGGMFLSAIQMLLPRLLSAAAPPGSTAQENLRQCLKVLRVWLDRKILPDSVVRHHIRELEFHGGASSAGVYSRRSSRTERSLDDPVREMEGMLVDEYGSNSSFQLPGFCMPRMRKDEDEGSDSDGGSFEAVTPEHKPDTPKEQETSNICEKHRHILEDVDGELEMEDVAPLCDVEMNASKNEYLQSSQDGSDQPILPSAPPPPPPPSLPPPCAISKSYSASVDSNIYAATNNTQDNSGQPVPPHSVSSRVNPRDKQMHRQVPDPAGSYPIRSGNNGARFYSKRYLPRPPHPALSDQFSYIQHAKSRREVSFPNRYHNNTGGGKFYNNHDRMKHAPYENGDNWRRHAPPFPGPRYADKGKTSYPHAGPSREPTRFLNQEWHGPPRSISHRNSLPMRHPSEGPNFWQPSR